MMDRAWDIDEDVYKAWFAGPEPNVANIRKFEEEPTLEIMCVDIIRQFYIFYQLVACMRLQTRFGMLPALKLVTSQTQNGNQS